MCEEVIDIYQFNLRMENAWEKIDTTNIPSRYKFIAWIYPEKSVMIIFNPNMSHGLGMKSVVENNVNDLCNKTPNAVGLCWDNKIVERYSSRLNLSSDDAAITTIEKFLKK